jgi:hypothetical protein
LTPFFDREDAYHIKTDLWRIGQVGIVLLDLFYSVNQDRNVIKLVDDFLPRFEALRTEQGVARGNDVDAAVQERDAEGCGPAGRQCWLLKPGKGRGRFESNLALWDAPPSHLVGLNRRPFALVGNLRSEALYPLL